MDRLYSALVDAILNDRDLPAETLSALARPGGDEGPAYRAANEAIATLLRTIPRKSYRVWPFARAAASRPASAFQETIGYLQFYRDFNSAVRDTPLATAPAEALQPETAMLLALVDEADRVCPTAGAHLLNRAKVLSLVDRSAAVEALAAARTASPMFLRHLTWDAGAETYLPPALLAAEPAASAPAELGEALAAALEQRAHRFAAPAAELLWSVDTARLRAHGPQWFDLAPALLGNYGLGMVMLVAGAPDEVGSLLGTARDLLARTARFHGASDPEAVAQSVVLLPVPQSASESGQSDAAAAGYLHARSLLAQTARPVLVLDMDWTPARPLDALLRLGKTHDLCIPAAQGHAALSPWRRYPSGCVLLNPTEGAAAFLDAMARYIVHGLRLPARGMLVENALTWAVERQVARIRWLGPAQQVGAHDPFRASVAS